MEKRGDEYEGGEKAASAVGRVLPADGDWFETMAATVTDQMAYIDESGVFRAANSAYVEATAARLGRELEADDVVGRPIGEVLPAALVEEVIQPNLARCLAGFPVSLQRWFELGGEPRYLHVHYHPHRSAGRVRGAVVVLRDHTALRQCQLRLREVAGSEEVMAGEIEAVAERLVEIAVEGLNVPSASLWRLDLAQPALHLLASREERNDIPPTSVMPLGDWPRLVQALADGHVVDAHEAMVDPRTRELTHFWLRPRRTLSVLAVPVMVGGHPVGVLWLEDGPELRMWQASDCAFATEAAALLAHVFLHLERRQLEMRLVEGQKREGLGVLAGGLAHDFNNLLVGILGGADLLHRQLADQPRPRQRLELILASARRASELCSQMLAYAGKGRLEMRRANLSNLTGGTVKLLRSTLDDNVELSIELSGGLPPIEADVTQVRQVVVNLVMNAAEALEGVPGSVRVITESVEFGDPASGPIADEGAPDASSSPVSAPVSKSAGTVPPGSSLSGMVPIDTEGFVMEAPPVGRYVLLRVVDSGCGMTDTTVERIFDPFFSTKFTGRGLGMAAVLGIVRAHRGGIRIDTKPGEGTQVEIILPAYEIRFEDEAEVVEAAGGSEAEATHFGDGERRALIVDDEEIVRIVATEMMEILGFEVTAVPNGLQALEILEQEADAFDIVLLDVTMPEMSGGEVLVRLRKLRSDLPVVIASGFSAEDLTRRFADHPIQGIIHKPYRFEELSKLVESVLA